MPLETATYISELVTTNPAGADPVAQADDHLRLIKAVLKNSFPSISGAMTVDQGTLNGLPGRVTSAEGNIASINSRVQRLENTKGLVLADAVDATPGTLFDKLSNDGTLLRTSNGSTVKLQVKLGSGLTLSPSGVALDIAGLGAQTGLSQPDLVAVRDVSAGANVKVTLQELADYLATLRPQPGVRVLEWAWPDTSQIVSAAHGLTTILATSVYAKCIVADAGYAVGNLIPIGCLWRTDDHSPPATVAVDATNVTVSFGRRGRTWRKDTAGSVFDFTPGRWALRVELYGT